MHQCVWSFAVFRCCCCCFFSVLTRNLPLFLSHHFDLPNVPFPVHTIMCSVKWAWCEWCLGEWNWVLLQCAMMRMIEKNEMIAEHNQNKGETSSILCLTEPNNGDSGTKTFTFKSVRLQQQTSDTQSNFTPKYICEFTETEKLDQKLRQIAIYNERS